MKQFFQCFSRNKYCLTVFGVLAFASVLAVGLVQFRVDQTNSGRYGFMIWNLFPAWIPSVIAYFTYTAKISRRWLYVVLPSHRPWSDFAVELRLINYPFEVKAH